ncbi:ATP-dependent RNA helicase DHX36 isoform X2 [Spatholobus suberectus]|nr:ATP-dependent RNA helicase DHX36 isoform X2 [Spatholobus suberectus]
MVVHPESFRDSTGISDSVLLLFGGNDGHLKMLGGYLEFFMKPELAKTYLSLKMELEELIQKKVLPQLKKETNSKSGGGGGGDNSKNQLQTFLNRAGHESPTYKTKQLKNNQFCSTVIFNGLNFVGQSCNSKKLAEKSAAAEALLCLKGDSHSSHDIDQASILLKKSNK